MSRKTTVTKEYIKSLKNRIETLEERLHKTEKDRQVFRDEFVSLLKQNVKMHSQNQYYSAETMILKLSSLMNRTESWYW